LIAHELALACVEVYDASMTLVIAGDGCFDVGFGNGFLYVKQSGHYLLSFTANRSTDYDFTVDSVLTPDLAVTTVVARTSDPTVARVTSTYTNIGLWGADFGAYIRFPTCFMTGHLEPGESVHMTLDVRAIGMHVIGSGVSVAGGIPDLSPENDFTEVTVGTQTPIIVQEISARCEAHS